MTLLHSEARIIRGRILKITEIAYPEEVGDETISLSLSDMNFGLSPALLSGYLNYLAEKGYIECRTVEIRDLGVSRRMIKLTAHGKDLLEGNIRDDPGVAI